jgi:hypothetical protein
MSLLFVLEHQKEKELHAVQPTFTGRHLGQCPKAQTQFSTCTITRFLRRQLGLQQAHSPLQIHARVRIGDPLKVLLYLLRNLLQTLR